MDRHGGEFTLFLNLLWRAKRDGRGADATAIQTTARLVFADWCDGDSPDQELEQFMARLDRQSSALAKS